MLIYLFWLLIFSPKYRMIDRGDSHRRHQKLEGYKVSSGCAQRRGRCLIIVALRQDNMSSGQRWPGRIHFF